MAAKISGLILLGGKFSLLVVTFFYTHNVKIFKNISFILHKELKKYNTTYKLHVLNSVLILRNIF